MTRRKRNSDDRQLPSIRGQEVPDPLARASFDVLLSGKVPLIRFPIGHSWMAKPAVEAAVGAIMSPQGLIDPQRWLDLQAACGHTAELYVIDRHGERYRVMDVLPDAGGETGQLLLRHLGRKSRSGDMLVDLQDGYGKMLPFVAYKKQNPPRRKRKGR